MAREPDETQWLWQSGGEGSRGYGEYLRRQRRGGTEVRRARIISRDLADARPGRAKGPSSCLAFVLGSQLDGPARGLLPFPARLLQGLEPSATAIRHLASPNGGALRTLVLPGRH